MIDRDRVCQRAGCARAASVTLSFRYDARQASLTDLSADKHPAHYDLCGAHADLLIVPRGWERLDRRIPRPHSHPEPELEAFVRSMEEPTPPPPRRMNRYAALTADLPRVAEACGLVPDRGRRETDRAVGLYEPVTATPASDEPPVVQLEGQLQMSIEPEPEGVVVALTRTRQP